MPKRWQNASERSLKDIGLLVTKGHRILPIVRGKAGTLGVGREAIQTPKEFYTLLTGLLRRQTTGVCAWSLLNHLTVDLLRESYYSLKRKAAPGVDGVTWPEYQTGLEDRLVDLHARVHRGAYRALPSRRVYIKERRWTTTSTRSRGPGR
jgi:hypothetical protein